MTLGYFDNRTTRHDTPARKAALLAVVWRGETLSDACRITNTHDGTVSKWRKSDPTFRIELAMARKAPRKLTDRDREVLRLVAHGYTNRMIAHALGLSVRAAGDLLTSLMRRRNVNCRAQLAIEAVKCGAIVVEVMA